MKSPALLLLIQILAATAPPPLPDARPHRLEEVLRHHGLSPTGPVAYHRADDLATNYAVLNDGRDFLIAYYRQEGDRTVGDPLSLLHFDREAASWRAAEIELSRSRGATGCLGAVMSVERSGDLFTVVTHLNPSAGCTLLLRRDLSLATPLYGRVEATFGDGRVIFWHSQVHWAPTHSAELSVLDPETGDQRQIYPLEPYGPLRRRHIARLAERVDPDWCMRANHHCDPEIFDNHLASEVAVRDPGSAAFVIHFDASDTWSPGERLLGQCFPETVKVARQAEAGEEPPPDDWFWALDADLAWIRRLEADGFSCPGNCGLPLEGGPKRPCLEPFGGELRSLLGKSLDSPRDRERFPREAFARLDSRWSEPRVLRRLEEILTLPPARTEILHVVRGAEPGGTLEYREILLSTIRERYGEVSLEALLEPERLEELFSR